MRRAAAHRLCEERNAEETLEPGQTWVPRETEPGEWTPVLVRLPSGRALKSDELRLSPPPGPRSLPAAPPLEPEVRSRLAVRLGHLEGRAFDRLGDATVAITILSPLFAYGWVLFRLIGFDSSETVRRVAIAICAVGAVSALIGVRVMRETLRTIRNERVPAKFSRQQWEVTQRVCYRLCQVTVPVCLLGVALAIPAQLY